MRGGRFEGVGESGEDKLFERGLALGRHNLGAMQNIVWKINSRFHKQYLQVYRDIVNEG